MKRNVKYKIIIALALLVIIAALIAGFFMSRRGDGVVHSAYDFSTTKKYVTETTTKKTTKKEDTKKTTKKGETTKTTSQKDSKTSDKTTASTSGKRVVVPAAYVNVLNSYQDALTKKTKAASLKEQKLSPVLASCYGANPQQNVGFLVDDYNGDGVTDLLIGTTDVSTSYDFLILDYYTLKDGKAVRVFQSQVKDTYYAVTNSRVLEKATDGSTYTAWYLYGFNGKGTALKLKEGVIQDKTANAKKPWFTAKDTDGDTTNDKHVSNEAGQKRSRQLEDAETQLDFISFSKYNRSNKNTTTTKKTTTAKVAKK